MGSFDYGKNSGTAPYKRWVYGATYNDGVVVFSPADGNYYMRLGAGAGTTDPSADTTNWRPLPTGIKSIQRGTISLSTGSATVTITAVNTAKTELRHLGIASGTADLSGFARITLTNSTTITANTNSVVATVVNWELTERY